MKIKLNEYDIMEHCYEIELTIRDEKYSLERAIDGLNELIGKLNKVKEAFND